MPITNDLKLPKKFRSTYSLFYETPISSTLYYKSVPLGLVFSQDDIESTIDKVSSIICKMEASSG